MKDTGNYTDENWEAELAESYSKLGIKQKKALRAFFEYHKNMQDVMRKFLAGDIKNAENAFLLLDSFFYEVLDKTVHKPGATDGLTIDYEEICALCNHYKTVIKNAAERNTANSLLEYLQKQSYVKGKDITGQLNRFAARVKSDPELQNRTWEDYYALGLTLNGKPVSKQSMRVTYAQN